MVGRSVRPSGNPPARPVVPGCTRGSVGQVAKREAFATRACLVPQAVAAAGCAAAALLAAGCAGVVSSPAMDR